MYCYKYEYYNNYDQYINYKRENKCYHNDDCVYIQINEYDDYYGSTCGVNMHAEDEHQDNDVSADTGAHFSS